MQTVKSIGWTTKQLKTLAFRILALREQGLQYSEIDEALTLPRMRDRNSSYQIMKSPLTKRALAS